LDNCKLSSVQSGIATEAAIADELSEAKCRSAVIGFSLSGVEGQNDQSVIGSEAEGHLTERHVSNVMLPGFISSAA